MSPIWAPSIVADLMKRGYVDSLAEGISHPMQSRLPAHSPSCRPQPSLSSSLSPAPGDDRVVSERVPPVYPPILKQRGLLMAFAAQGPSHHHPSMDKGDFLLLFPLSLPRSSFLPKRVRSLWTGEGPPWLPGRLTTTVPLCWSMENHFDHHSYPGPLRQCNGNGRSPPFLLATGEP